jgi:hypothetical protein
MHGFDLILLSSKINPNSEFPCGGDRYSGSYNPDNPNITKPVTWYLPTNILRGVEMNNAYLQIFIDDFQALSLCSMFQSFINGTRFAEGEKLLNAIDQTGPVGKLILNQNQRLNWIRSSHFCRQIQMPKSNYPVIHRPKATVTLIARYRIKE